MRYFTFSWNYIFEIRGVSYIYSTSQIRLATFGALRSHMRSAATIMDSRDLDPQGRGGAAKKS